MKKFNILDVTVFYINMDKDVEKKDRVVSLLESKGFSDIRRVPGVPHENKKTGVALAHKAALLAGLEINKPFIVFEDDIIEHTFREDLYIPEDADAYYLGVSAWGLISGTGKRVISVEEHSRGVYRLYNMLSAHAILYLNLDYAKFLLKSIDFFIKIKTNQDKGRAESMKYWNVYASQKPLFSQGGKFRRATSITLPGPRATTPSSIFLDQNNWIDAHL